MSELALITLPDPKSLFDGSGMDAILKGITEKAKSYELDVTTESGRKEIASIAYKVAKSKTAIDEQGKTLVAGIKAEAKLIDSERKKARDYLDSLKAEIRKPLTEFEDAEKERVANHESRLNWIKSVILEIPETSAEISKLCAKIEEVDPDTFEEFSSKAAASKEVALAKINAAYSKAVTAEKEREELERLRKQQEERERQEREERIKVEAAEKARRDAEEKAAQDKREAEENHQREIAAQKAEAEQRERKIREEAEKAEREAQANRDAEEAAQKAKAKEAARIEAEAEARRKDKEHRGRVNTAAAKAINELAIEGDPGKAIVTAIAKGQITNITINY